MIYFVTFNTKDRYPFFENQILCDLFIKELEICKLLKSFHLYAFCILHDHMHLIIEPCNLNISKVMQSLKKESSRDINYLLNETEIPESRFQAIDELKDFELKYKLLSLINFIDQYKNINTNLPYFIWNKSFHREEIRDKEAFEAIYNYTVYNYKRHKYNGEYKYTSNNYPEIIDKLKKQKRSRDSGISASFKTNADYNTVYRGYSTCL